MVARSAGGRVADGVDAAGAAGALGELEGALARLVGSPPGDEEGAGVSAPSGTRPPSGPSAKALPWLGVMRVGMLLPPGEAGEESEAVRWVLALTGGAPGSPSAPP